MSKQKVIDRVEANRKSLEDMSYTIWEYAETAYQEFKSSALQKEYLAERGFTIREVPNLPTAFIAEYGSGSPIIGMIGEYDALPNLSQQLVAEPAVREENPAAGHGCGHNLLGTGALGAALAIKEQMEEEGLSGTIRYYGCPAEELMSGKPLMAKEGVFDDLDAAYSWHPTFENTIWGCSFLAMNSMKFRFKGKSAHAAAAPHDGRSALDAVELMNVGANYLREHVVDAVRIHYCITNGGAVPNSVPADAEVWYMVRAPKRSEVRETVARLVKIAQGAAMMTETEMSYELLGGCYDVIANHTMGDILEESMALAGPPDFDDADKAYAKEFAKYIPESNKRATMGTYSAPDYFIDLDLHDGIEKPLDYGVVMAGSTDVGDISYITPFAQMTAACWPVGVGSHTWIASACTGHSIGKKAMVFVAKSLAAAGYELLTCPDKLQAAKDEFQKATGGAKYISPYDE